MIKIVKTRAEKSELCLLDGADIYINYIGY